MSGIDLMEDKYKALRAFTMHGVALHSNSGTQVLGDCPFCSKDNKFYINPENLLWDCKVCGISGNRQTFLEKINDRNKKQIKQEHIEALAGDRGLPSSALQWLELGFNGQYTIAVRDVSGKLVDLRIYKIGGKTISTSGSSTGLLGLAELLKAKTEPVYICEGEWDTVAVQWLLAAARKPGRAVCSPGAGTFKPDWADFFKGRVVNVLYDHDAAGLKGEMVVLDRLVKVAKQLMFCHWPAGKPEGYDARDFILKNGVAKKTPKRCFRLLSALLKDKPRTSIGQEIEAMLEENKAPEVDPSVTISDVIRSYQELLHEPNKMAIELAVIMMISNLFDTDPIWMFLVAPPSSGKTQVINGLKYLCQPYDEIGYSMSAITTHALISGMETKKGDPSVFAKLDGKRMALIIKDYSTVTSMPESEKLEINAQLRDGYDGYTSKSFGNGVVRTYNNLRFSLLAAVTDDIYNEAVTNQALGERFAKLNIGRSNDIAFAEGAMDKALSDDSRAHFKENEDRCARMVYSCVKNIMKKVEDGTQLPKLSPELQEAIKGISLYVASMRGVVSRDKFRRDYIKSAPYSETGIRFAKMIANIAAHNALMYGRETATLEDLPLVRRIALDTIGQRDEEILRRVWLLNKEDSSREPLKHIIQEGSKYTQYTVHCVLEDLVMLDMLNRQKEGRKHYYRVSEKTRAIVSKAKLYETEEELSRNNHKVILKRAPNGMGDPRRKKLTIKRRAV